MKRTGGLTHARASNWLSKNADAKNLVRRYRRYFGVDLALPLSNCVRSA